jgi:hypothetical protein
VGSFYPPRGSFDPLDLDIIERVYEDALLHIHSFDPLRDRQHDAEREAFLRRRVFALAKTHPVEYDALLHKVLRGFEVWTVIPLYAAKKKRRKNHPR